MVTGASDSEKGRPFECGFTSLVSSSVSFSVPFFIIAMIFLLFDVEILLICFYPVGFFSGVSFFFVTYFVVFLVLFSTLYEWLKGIFLWS